MLTVDGTPKISDFGLARKLERETGLTQSGAAVGTPSYMAPEQALGKSRSTGPAADVYALGAILYETLTGRPPFRAETALETVRQVISQEPVPPSHLNSRVPRDLETICLKCLSKEPSFRYSSANALADDLKRYLQGETISARPEGRLARLGRRIRRRPVLSGSVILGAVLVLLQAGGAVWLMSKRAAVRRAVEEDLSEMVNWQESSAWTEANASLQRAKGRLGNGGPTDLQERVDQGRRDLELVARLDTIRLNRVDQVGSMLPFVRADERAEQEYEKQFSEAGIGRVHDDIEVCSTRIRNSKVGKSLVAALDDWAVCCRDPDRQKWLLEVARKADQDSMGWRGRARELQVRKNKGTLEEFLQTAPVSDQSVSLQIALAQYLEEAGGDPIPFLTRLQQAHPSDFWTNYILANKLRERLKLYEAIRYYQAAMTIRPRTSPLNNNLGLSLMGRGQLAEATWYFERALEIDPENTAAFGNRGIVWYHQGFYDKALERLRQAIARQPEFAAFYYYLGLCSEKVGDEEAALVYFRRTTEIDAKIPEAWKDLRRLLARRGQMEELRATWAQQLEQESNKHDSWYGYAELCLFLNRESDYRRARELLLNKFGSTSDPHIAERTARACLLFPASQDELRQVLPLVELATKVDRGKFASSYPHFLFVRGLIEYRQEKYHQAILTLRGEAAAVLGPIPRLVLSMALFRSGQTTKARETLQAAIANHDWSANRIRTQDDWISHILRREAEKMILAGRSSLPNP